jgi:hypothetical protein
MIVLRTVGVVALVMFITACVPIPRRHYFAPMVDGVILTDGIPDTSSSVRLSASGHVLTAATDSSGHFSVGPISRIQPYTMLMGDPICAYSLEIIRPSTINTGLKATGIGYCSLKEAVICDLSQSQGDRTTRTYCRPANHTAN